RRRGGRRARHVRGLVGAVHARRRPVGRARRRPRARSAHGIARALQGEAAGATLRGLGEGLGGARHGLTPTKRRSRDIPTQWGRPAWSDLTNTLRVAKIARATVGGLRRGGGGGGRRLVRSESELVAYLQFGAAWRPLR